MERISSLSSLKKLDIKKVSNNEGFPAESNDLRYSNSS
uniref:Uncharacterized protein n=1 Tax=Rhizophora mucronata TaxID=61149 RepID=A0A2P2QBB2_RHIMU